MRINNNISALNAWRNLTNTDFAMSKSLERLSSGFRINRAADDAAGLAISEKIRGQIRGLNQAVRNAQDAISLIQTAEGALNETHSILQRMRELADQSASDTNTLNDRKKIQQEMDQLAAELTRVTNTTEFNTKNLLGGFFSGKFHIGANENQTMDVTISAMDAATLGVARDTLEARAASSNTVVTAADGGDDLLLDAGAYSIRATDGLLGNTAAGSYTVGSTDETLTLNVGGTDRTVNFEANKTYSAQEIVDNINAQIGQYITARIGEGGKIEVIAKNVNEPVSVTALTSSDFLGTAMGWGVDGGGTTGILELRVQSGSAVYDTVVIQDGAVSAKFAAVDLSVTLSSVNETVNEDIEVYASQASSAAVLKADGTIADAVVRTVETSEPRQRLSERSRRLTTRSQVVSNQRSQLGALQNRLEHTIANLSVAAENLTSAESRIRDVDMAQEMVTFTRNQILLQAGMAMMAQANTKPQAVLQLLR